jgi:hypothetical protein
MTYRQLAEMTGLYKTAQGFTSFFRNRIYTGIFDYGGEEYGTPDDPFVPQMIPVEWFEEEAERRESRAIRRRKGGSAQPGEIEPRHVSGGRLLSGLLVCARCGANLWVDMIPAGVISTTGQVRKEWPFYWCSRAKQKTCDAGKVHATRLERGIIHQLHADILTPENIHAHAARLLDDIDGQKERLNAELAVLVDRHAQTGQQIERIVDAIADRAASPALLNRLDEMEATRRSLKQRIISLQAELAHLDHVEIDDSQLMQLVDLVTENLESGDKNTARAALSMLISHIEVEPGTPLQATVHYTCPGFNRGVDLMPPRRFELLFQP